MRVIEDASAGSLHPFVQDCIEPGSTIHTDGWQGYAGLDNKGYRREITKLRGRRKEASELMPRPPGRLVTEALLLGTHQGAHISTSRTTWMNSRFGSIAASPRAAASSSSVSCSRPSVPLPLPTIPWSGGQSPSHNLLGELSERDTHLRANARCKLSTSRKRHTTGELGSCFRGSRLTKMAELFYLHLIATLQNSKGIFLFCVTSLVMMPWRY